MSNNNNNTNTNINNNSFTNNNSNNNSSNTNNSSENLSPLCVQLSLIVLSLLFNIVGIYCLRHRKRGNKNQQLLLQNLAIVEIMKILYDMVSLLIYYVHKSWYVDHYKYFMTVEIYLMSVLYCTFLYITLDRLLCVLLKVSYKRKVTLVRTRHFILGTWMLAPLPGILVSLTTVKNLKQYYYIAFDVFVTVVIILSYAFTTSHIRRKSKRYMTVPSIVPLLLTVSFLLFNVVPDVIFLFLHDWTTFEVISFMWTAGYLCDPMIYIFPTKQSRRHAITFIKNIFTYGGFSCLKSVHGCVGGRLRTILGGREAEFFVVFKKGSSETYV